MSTLLNKALALGLALSLTSGVALAGKMEHKGEKTHHDKKMEHKGEKTHHDKKMEHKKDKINHDTKMDKKSSY